MMITFHSMPFRRHFRANICSQATLLAVALSCISVVAPLIWSMVTQSFWLKENTFREQPSVLYMKDLLLVLEGTTGTGTNESPLVLFYANNPDLNQLFEDNVRAVPSVKTSELDFNRDGLPDQLLFNISMPLLPTDRIFRARLALVLRYELSVRSPSMNWAPVGLGVGASSFPIPVARNAARVRFSEDRIVYRPGSLEVLKAAWIQYLSHLIVTVTLCRWVFVWAVRCQIVPTHIAVDVLPRHASVSNGFKSYPKTLTKNNASKHLKSYTFKVETLSCRGHE
ncbi:transmembrane protein 231-domain-containing protein [Chytridium lagenaria]|nr:transmembrane protein 231-domain-containing protein [Chytridium lagenaria]